MKKVLLLISLILLSTSLFSTWNEITENTDKNLFDFICSDLEQTEINFALDGYKIDNITHHIDIFQKISYPNEGEFIETGKPALPRFTRLIAVPDEGEFDFCINNLEEEIIPNIILYPHQPLQSESQPNNNEFVINEEYYKNGEIFPSQIVEVGNPAILRDFRIVSVTINPFQYDPQAKELRIIRNIDVTVTTNGSIGENLKSRDRKVSRFFEPLYESVIQNYDSIINRDDEYQQPSYLFIYPDNIQVEEYLETLTDWKHQKGFEVTAANTSETGTSLNSIKDYIQNAYDNWENPPEFVCIVGDAGGSFSIPTGHYAFGQYNGEGDHYYTMLEGDDYLSDIFIGRLSFNTLTEFQTIISKIINYEKMPYMGNTEWYNKAFLVGDPTYSGPSCIDTKIHIKDMIDVNSPNIECTEVYSGNWVMHMNNNLNEGVSYFNYRGFVYMSGWNNTHIDNLNNGFMLPVVVSLTCLTGDFEGTNDCISERFLKAGSPSVPKGGIAAISTATGNTHTCFNNCLDAGIFYGIFSDEIYNMGGALCRGKLNLHIHYPNNPYDYVVKFSYWGNLMGDPGMEIWTGIPEEMEVSYDSEVALGTNYMEVIVEDINDLPIEGAWVTALMGDDEIFSTGYTDEEGRIFLPIEANTTGEVNLTVTKHNFIPHLGSLDVVQEDIFVNVYEFEIDDDNSGTSSGNGDGLINQGEDIELRVSLENFGTTVSNFITATVSSTCEYISITDDIEEYGNIPAGTSIFSDDDFDFSVDAGVLGGTEIIFDLLIEDDSRNQWTDRIYLTVAGANPYATGYNVIDGNNSLLEPGETADFEVIVENLGLADIDDIYGLLSSSDNRITVDDPNGYFGTLSVGTAVTNSDDRFIITASNIIVPGSQIILDLQLYNSSGFDYTVSFMIEVGEVSVNNPLGPDTFGHYMYDDEDTQYINTASYQWIEIDPNYGGPGTILEVGDIGNMGNTVEIETPFNLKFYGVDYSSISICTNGWLRPGSTQMMSFMNWNIPGPLGPSPCIAVFWDDLKLGDIIQGNYIPNGGCVCYYYDETQNYFIIEWSHLQNEYDSSEETFQVIIYDQYNYPTSTGDNAILFQYKEINNVDQGNYETFLVSHGQYATIGIEDHTSTVGLEYTYNNTYPTAAKTLENEMAIMISGCPISQDEPYIVIGGITINDENGNGQVDYAENIALEIILNNLGGNEASNVNATISSTDEYITIDSDYSEYNNIAGGSSEMNLEDFSIIIDDVCPDAHTVHVQLDIESDEDNWSLYFNLELNAPDILFTDLFVEDNNNYVLDPGETADLYVTFMNYGGAEAYSVMSYLQTSDPNLTINSGTWDIGTLSGNESSTAIFNVTANTDLPVGYEVDLTWEINTDYGYNFQGEIPFYLVQFPVNFTEEFNSFPPPGWSTEGGINWFWAFSNAAGGSPPEAIFFFDPLFEGTQRLITRPINTAGSVELILEFTHTFVGYGGDYSIGVQSSDDGENWNNAWLIEDDQIIEQTVEITINTPDVGSQNFQLAFFFEGNTNDIQGWAIDDIVLHEVPVVIHGYITGNVNLLNGNGNVEEVLVTTGENSGNPDEDGNYLIQVEPGTYNLSAILAGYITSTVDNVEIDEPWETVIVDFELTETTIEYPPQNLSATIDVNDIYLDWDFPGYDPYDREHRKNPEKRKNHIPELNVNYSKDSNDHLRFLTGYNVYKDGEIIEFISDITNTHYNDMDLNSGDYSYYITAIYDEGESSPSNELDITIILPPPDNFTGNVTPLGQNVILSWEAPNSQVTGYNIYRDEELIVETQSTYYFDAGVPQGTHVYGVTAEYDEYESEPAEVIVEVTDTDDNEIPLRTELIGNYPNPFNPANAGAGRSTITTIDFSLKKPSKVSLNIFNIKGEKVISLVDEYLEPAYYSYGWDGTNYNGKKVPSGIYFYSFKVNDKSITTKKMILLK